MIATYSQKHSDVNASPKQRATGHQTELSKAQFMDTQTLEQNWTAYLAAYSDIADDERKQLLEHSVSDDMVFTNPSGQGETRAGLIAHIENFQKMMPGTYFSTEKVFVHHDELLAIWAMHKPDGTKAATGYNFVRPDNEGRLLLTNRLASSRDPKSLKWS